MSNITITIEAPGLAAAIQALAAALSSNVTLINKNTDPVQTAETLVKVGEAYDALADVVQEQSSNQTPDTASSSNSADNTGTDNTTAPTVVELRAKAQEKGKTPEGKQAIKALLDKFNSKSISNVPEVDRAAFMAELEAL